MLFFLRQLEVASMASVLHIFTLGGKRREGGREGGGDIEQRTLQRCEGGLDRAR